MSRKIQIAIVEDNAAYARSLQEIIRTSEDIYEKLQVPNVAAAVAAAIRKGLI